MTCDLGVMRSEVLSGARSAGCRANRAPPATPRRRLLRHCLLSELIVGERSELLRHDHAPRVEDELAELVLVDGLQANDQPLVAHGRLRAQKLVRVRLESSFALLLRKGEAHQRLVTREGQIDDPSNAELDPDPDETSYDRGNPAVRSRTSSIPTAISRRG